MEEKDRNLERYPVAPLPKTAAPLPKAVAEVPTRQPLPGLDYKSDPELPPLEQVFGPTTQSAQLEKDTQLEMDIESAAAILQPNAADQLREAQTKTPEHVQVMKARHPRTQMTGHLMAQVSEEVSEEVTNVCSKKRTRNMLVWSIGTIAVDAAGTCCTHGCSVLKDVHDAVMIRWVEETNVRIIVFLPKEIRAIYRAYG